MALIAGTRLGPYEMVSALGAGGMGEVYRARDTKLHRDVAIKVLPESLAADADRLARFQREAQALASLNHPNIAHIHGLEESDGVRALVMELVEGEDLAQRIARGPIPIDEALPIARQIAEALEAAHEQGIIHRDLKPANIKVRPDAAVKVLDFGLAKLVESGDAAPAGRENLTQSPTITTPAMTQAGMILGTAAYMSPEQARGKPVDRRADIWAFGCVLFEMITGRRPFDGELISDVLASVLKTEPNWRTLPVDTPSALERLLRRCLEKDPRRRLQAIGEARVQIDDLLSGAPEVVGAPAPARAARLWRRVLPWSLTGMAVAALMLVLVLWAPWRPEAATPRLTRTTIAASGPVALTINGNDRDLALSPDGTHVVYVGNGGTQLFARALDALEPVPIATGTGLRSPFISPDGQWVGFVSSVSGTTLHKVAITGGPPILLAHLSGTLRGASWAADDAIIFATNNLQTGLQRVSAAGGPPEVLTDPDRAQGEADHLWPEVLPGGGAVLFTITSQIGALETAQVAVRDLRTGTQKILLRGGSDAHYVAGAVRTTRRGEREGGHLVYVAAGTLRAIPFDPMRLETHGTAVPVLSRLITTATGAGDFAMAADGTLVYVDVPGGLAVANGRTLAWVDRAGKEESLAAQPRAYQHPRLSPDGTRVALAVNDQENDLWIWDLRRANLTRLTSDPGVDWFPVWTADDRRIIFSSNRSGQFNLWWQAADGTGGVERLTTSSKSQFPTGITPDGTAVVFFEATTTGRPDLLQVALDGTHRVTPLLQTKFDKRNAIVSPDGRWLAYESNSSGATEIYVRPFPNVDGGQWQVSTEGGKMPLWARSGKELFYVSGDGALMRVFVEASGATWNAGTPVKLLERGYYAPSGYVGRTYDVSSDGQHFLMIKAPATDGSAAPPALIVVQHWDEELKRLVPTR
jgi:serine/threonine-protein kinase